MDDRCLSVDEISPDTDLSVLMKFGGLSCSPGDRMALHLRALNTPLGIVTNGERRMLVHAPTNQVATFANRYARIRGQEPATIRSLKSLLSLRRFAELNRQRYEEKQLSAPAAKPRAPKDRAKAVPDGQGELTLAESSSVKAIAPAKKANRNSR